MNLKSALKGTLSRDQLPLLVRGFDVVGDIAITIIPPELTPMEREIGKAILKSNKRLRVVAKRVGHYGGEFRTLPLQIIAGENRKETIHKEHGVRLLLNVETVYYSVRMAAERRRVAGCVQAGEKVAVLCSGIGPFPLVMAKHSQAAEIIGIEKNPVAHNYALRNLAVNKKINNVTLLYGDASTLLPQLTTTFDRVVVVFPKNGEHLLDTGLAALQPSGWLHFYTMEQVDSHCIEKVRKGCRQSGRHLAQYSITSCGHCAPRTKRFCIDARIVIP